MTTRCNSDDRVKLSVVIPYYRGAATIAGQLEALARQTWRESWEVVISDNEGSDEVMEIARTFANRLNLRVVNSSDRRSRGHARNVGVKTARGEVIAFTDQDDEVGAGWLSAMGDALSQYDFVACRSDMKKLNPEWVQEVFAYDPQVHRLPRLKFPPYVPYGGGSSLGIRRTVHERVGGFDESWRCWDDVDYCVRVQLSGTELRFVPEALLHYRFRTTMRAIFEQARSFAGDYVRLYKRYRTPGGGHTGSWKREVTRLHFLFQTRSQAWSPSASTRAAWFLKLGWSIGRLQGCVRYLTSPPP